MCVLVHTGTCLSKLLEEAGFKVLSDILYLDELFIHICKAPLTSVSLSTL